MRINNNKINKMLDSLNDKSQIDKFLNHKFNNKNTFDLIPFKLELGIVNSTETGFQEDNITVDSFSSYAKVITGLNSLLAKWDNAYKVYLKNPTDLFLTKEYSIGRVIKATSSTLSNGSNTIPSPIDSTFNQIEIDENITIQIKEQLSAEDILKVFIIPQKNKWRWLYIPANGITEYFDKNNNFVYADVQLSSVNSIYATSGGAIEQFIQKSAPGDGYAWPKYTNDILELDEIRARDLPITSAQREYSGGSSFGTIYYYGRPTQQGLDEDGDIINIFNPKIEASRILLPFLMETPKISPINTKPSAETDYFIGNGKPTLHQEYANWKEQWGSAYDLETRKAFQGILELEPIETLELSNPLFKGTRQFTLWDTDFKINYTNKTFDCSTNKLTGGKDIVLNGDKTIPEILAHNIFILNHLTTLPMNAETNITWKLSDTWLIGGFLNTLTLGIPIGWTDNNVRVQMGDVPLIIPANIVLYGNEIINNKTKSWVPFDLFKENKSDIVEDSGIAGMGSTIKYSLTDQFELKGVIYNTLQLGQKLPNGEILYWTGECKPVQKSATTPGYAIDRIIDKSIAMTNCRTTFFSYGFEAYQVTNTTKSKFTGEIRDWTNDIILSNWQSSKGIVSYPEIIQQPAPITTEPTNIEIPFPRNILFGVNEDNSNITDNPDYWFTKKEEYLNVIYISKPTFTYNDFSVEKFEFNYSNYAINLQQLALEWEYFVLEYIDQNNIKQYLYITIASLLNNIYKKELFMRVTPGTQNIWDTAEHNYRQIRYSRTFNTLNISIDALTKGGILIFDLSFSKVRQEEPSVTQFSNNGKISLKSVNYRNENRQFTTSNAFIVPKNKNRLAKQNNAIINKNEPNNK